MRTALAGCLSLLLLNGCSDPKKANAANFKKAINAYLEKQPLCIDAPNSSVTPAGQEKRTSAFPAYIEAPRRPTARPMFDMQAKPFEALTKAGLVSARSGEIDVKSFMSFRPNDNTKLAVRVYDLTAAGRKAFVPGGNPYADKLCYGTAEVDEVTQFTEPSPAFGATFSAATYTYHVKDEAGWAKDANVQAAFPGLKQANEDKKEGKAQLVLTNNGWVDSRGSKL